jgi:hypothetical protein
MTTDQQYQCHKCLATFTWDEAVRSGRVLNYKPPEPNKPALVNCPKCGRLIEIGGKGNE